MRRRAAAAATNPCPGGTALAPLLLPLLLLLLENDEEAEQNQNQNRKGKAKVKGKSQTPSSREAKPEVPEEKRTGDELQCPQEEEEEQEQRAAAGAVRGGEVEHGEQLRPTSVLDRESDGQTGTSGLPTIITTASGRASERKGGGGRLGRFGQQAAIGEEQDEADAEDGGQRAGGRAISTMKGLFKNKPRTPAELVRVTRDMLSTLDAMPQSRVDARKEEKVLQLVAASNFASVSKCVQFSSQVVSLLNDLNRNIRDMKNILYGSSETEPVPETCAQLTNEIFKDNTFRLLIQCLPKLDLELESLHCSTRFSVLRVKFCTQKTSGVDLARKDSTQVVANLQRQQVQSRLIACDYLEKNRDLLDILVAGYKNPEIALHYGTMLRECIRHQSIARFVLESGNVEKFFVYVELPNFDVASDASATFKELLTRHKSTVADYFARNFEWFFGEFNRRLLESTNYITKRQAVKDDSKNIQIEAFHVFKVFVSNPSKPPEIVSILLANRHKLLRFLNDFKTEKEQRQDDDDDDDGNWGPLGSVLPSLLNFVYTSGNGAW
ncbi:hypothetical protein AXG93_3891s1200 [Marchantia polymorpha subsp. ruderalis]|uniref:MO25-like protein n=1 Tax=Marchantia polymorpha subsp. ruderalis TaxID=1480154 RepID=A0A176WLG7_MARPO|nr:hypothetical protein AXG93_3891s1200 [Marchantia polymorpha subsp. ruderalis]